MHEMEGNVKSGGVLNKKSSSGCLIVKKKDGLGGSGEKKMPKIVENVSGSSDDEDESLEFMRRKVNNKRLHNGRSNVGMEISGDRKRSRLDLFDFDEYDEFDEKKMRNKYVEDRFKMVGRGVGSSNRNSVLDKQKHGSYIDGPSSGRSKGFELEDDEAHIPISSLRFKHCETANEPIRLQGKNGVLKIVMNKKKKNDIPSQHKNSDPTEVEKRRSPSTEDVSSKDLLAQSPVHQGLKTHEKRNSFFYKEKKEVELEKVGDLEIDDGDTDLKLAPEGLQASSSKKVVKNKVVQRKEEKEDKLKRGGSTEKQMLREKIRGILIDAGWSIDYRPRRNRDYLDAVYINPSGTAYWSIIKAYDAFKKHLGEDIDKSKLDRSSPSITSLSDDLLHKLTRRTKKKIEEETKRKEAGLTERAKKYAVIEASGILDSDGLPKMKSKKVRAENTRIDSRSNILQGRTSEVMGRCTLLVRGSDKGGNSESDGYFPCSGKRTILGWLIDSGVAQLSEKLQYMNRKRTRAMLKGWITRDGIHCGCCSKILTISKFELHAGSKLCQPFKHIYLESGASLLQCQIDAWNKQDEPLRQDFHVVGVDCDDPNDDTCGVCGDGGELICCDSCPSTFHQICSGIQTLPSGDWHCPNCTCKFCGDPSGKVAGGNDTNSTVDKLIRCSVCEKKYHKSCNEDVYVLPMTSHTTSFCDMQCKELYDHLQKILGVKHELGAGFSWSLIQRTNVSDTSVRAYHHRVTCNSKLAVALSVMDECFLPIIDRKSGLNMIQNVVYNCGSNFNRLNYCGFYTAILEQGDELVSAACIRIHGTRLAEMPFIGTREIFRRQGMCRRLLSAIELELSSLKVENLIIPAVSEHRNTWTSVFGFNQLEDVLKKEIKSMNMVVFPGIDMLQKKLLKQEVSDVLGIKVSDPTEKADINPILGSDTKTSIEVNDLDPCSPPQPLPSNGFKIESRTVSDNAELACIHGNLGHVSVESRFVSASESSAQGIKPDVKDEESLAQLKPDINQPTELPIENKLHSSITQVSADVHIDKINESQNPAPISTLPDSGESNSSCSAEVNYKNMLVISGIVQEATDLAGTN